MEAFLLHNHHTDMKVLSRKMGIAEGEELPGKWEKRENQVIIQWDRYSTQSQKHRQVLNPTAAVNQMLNPQESASLLRLNGIPFISSVQNQKVVVNRQYYILMFQFQSLALYQYRRQTVWRPGRNHPFFDGQPSVKQEQYSKEMKRGIGLSVRTLYALGLDFAGVWLGVRTNGKLCVMGVDPTPRCSLEEKKKYLTQFIRYTQSSSTPTEVTLGTDIEFLLQDASGNLVPASKYFSYRGRVGYDALRNPQRRADHPIVELRPYPSKSPIQLYRNLYTAMKMARRHIGNQLSWLVGNEPIAPFSIGGHLHFGRAPLNFQIIRVLDEYLALPFRLLEDPRGVSRRPRYGRLGDVRKKAHGYEYRTLPSFIYTPKITAGVLTLAIFLIENYLKLPVHYIYLLPVQRHYYQGNGAELYSLAEEKLLQIERMEGYQHIRRYTSSLFQQIREGKPWDEHRDIRPAWKL